MIGLLSEAIENYAVNLDSKCKKKKCEYQPEPVVEKDTIYYGKYSVRRDYAIKSWGSNHNVIDNENINCQTVDITVTYDTRGNGNNEK